jgi:hypothetical protein
MFALRRKLAAFAFIVCPSLAVAAADTITGDTLHHTGLHLSVTKPNDWRFQTAKEKRDARYAITYKNKGLDSRIKLNPFPPRIVISKYAEPRKEFNPTVTIDRYPLDNYRFKDGAWVAYQVHHNWQYLLDRLEIVEPVNRGVLDQKVTGCYRIRYKLEVKTGGPFLIEERVWAVATGLMTYLITARGLQEGEDAAVAEIDAIVASIKFDAK